MEVRDYHGAFVAGGRTLEPMTLRVIVSTGGGVTQGSGDFEVPAALAGFVREDEPLAFVTADGDRFTVVLREFDLVEGRAWFVTEGALPQTQTARRA